MRDCSFHFYIVRFWISTGEMMCLQHYQFGCYMAGATRNCCRLDARSVHTIQPYTSLQCHFIRSHIRSVRVLLTITCHMHFWQNYRDLLRATTVPRRWNWYRNNSRESWPRKFSCRSFRDSNPPPFDNVSDSLPLTYTHYHADIGTFIILIVTQSNVLGKHLNYVCVVSWQTDSRMLQSRTDVVPSLAVI